MRKKINLFLLILLSCPKLCGAYCFSDAANIYHIDPILLIVIANHESNMYQFARNINYKKGVPVSEDIGVMQVNSTWIKKLSNYGITRNDLFFNPCLNVKVGTWILANGCNLKEMSWDCVGAYNAGMASSKKLLRLKYSSAIYFSYKNAKEDNKYLFNILKKIPR